MDLVSQKRLGNTGSLGTIRNSQVEKYRGQKMRRTGCKRCNEHEIQVFPFWKKMY